MDPLRYEAREGLRAPPVDPRRVSSWLVAEPRLTPQSAAGANVCAAPCWPAAVLRVIREVVPVCTASQAGAKLGVPIVAAGCAVTAPACRSGR